MMKQLGIGHNQWTRFVYTISCIFVCKKQFCPWILGLAQRLRIHRLLKEPGLVPCYICAFENPHLHNLVRIRLLNLITCVIIKLFCVNRCFNNRRTRYVYHSNTILSCVYTSHECIHLININANKCIIKPPNAAKCLVFSWYWYVSRYVCIVYKII